MKWISVKDLLPEESKDVLMAYDYSIVSKKTIYMGFYFKKRWHFAEEGEYIGDDRTVTHWMPLPEPPQNQD